jgi:hypothetical protein
MSRHTRIAHPRGSKEPTVINMTPEEEYKELMEWAYQDDPDKLKKELERGLDYA